MMSHSIGTFYQFVDLSDLEHLRSDLLAICQEHDVQGTILLADEGINASLCGAETSLRSAISRIDDRMPGETLRVSFAACSTQAFDRLKVKLKREIVTMRSLEDKPLEQVGQYVDACDWNAFIQRPDVITIDTRNDYEYRIGTFEGAVLPDITAFGDFPDWWQAHADAFKGFKIAMFCTGGIRCEKSTCHLVNRQVPDVYHLKGGILSYLQEQPEHSSLWSGECFVFDNRVSVKHGLKEGDACLCYACRRPLEPADTLSEHYEEGVSCHLCVHDTSDADKARFRERQRQRKAQEVSG